MTAIQVQNLTKSYRVFRKQPGLWASVRGLFSRQYQTVEAVKGVSFSIEQGEMVAFLGPNGAGKTTTLKLLAGLIYPTAGSASVLGYVPWQRDLEYRRRFALVMGQKNQLWWDLPARDSFQLHKEIYRIPAEEYTRRVDELTDLLEVRKLLGQPVRELSLGERMRMELIAALLHSPEVLFLDEPTIGLDVVSQRRVQEFLLQYQRERRITVILTSHYMKDVEALCQRAIIINEGVIKHDGPLAQILDRFSTHKVIEVQYAGQVSRETLQQYGTVIDLQPPRAKIKVARQEIPTTLSRLLQTLNVEDISVHERPLEEAIADMFQEQSQSNQAGQRPAAS